MKKLFTENIGLKLGSVVIAIILWILVVYTYDPAATTNFNLGVDIINGDSIASSGKVYEVIEGDTITIRVKANASLIKSLKASDFKATADVSKQFPVTIEKSGEPESGYYVGETIASPNLISVSGGKKSVEKISVVKVKADVNGANSLFYADGIPKAYDADGNEITTGSLKFSDNPVKVAVNVYKTKNVSIVVEAQGEPYKGYSVQDINYEPKTVTVAGPDQVLSKLSSIKLPLNVEGEITDIEVSINLSDYIKEGVYLVDKDVLVNAKCNIVRLGTKEFELLPSDISLNNKSDKFNYELIDTEKIKVTISGLSEKLKNIEVSDLAPYVDLSNAKEVGDYSYKVKFREIDGVKIESTGAVTVKASKISDSTIDTVSAGAVDVVTDSAIDTDEKTGEQGKKSDNEKEETEVGK